MVLPAGVGVPSETRKVLVVDDERDIRLLVRVVLARAGFTVLEAGSAEAGLRMLESEPVDVIVLALRMDGMGGWGLIDELQRTGDIERTRVVVLSAHAGPDVACRILDAGCSAFLTKPFTKTELLEAIGPVLA